MVFKTIESDITSSGKALSIFNKDMALFVKNWNNTQGFKNRLKSAFSNPNVISQKDLIAITKYNNAISTGINKQTAFYQHLSNSSIAVQNLAANAKYGTISTDGLTVATKKSTVASKAFGIALKTALNIGFALAINAIISGITYLVNKQEELEKTHY